MRKNERWTIKCKSGKKLSLVTCQGLVDKTPDDMQPKLKSMGAKYRCPFAVYESYYYYSGYVCNNKGQYDGKTINVCVKEIRFNTVPHGRSDLISRSKVLEQLGGKNANRL